MIKNLAAVDSYAETVKLSFEHLVLNDPFNAATYPSMYRDQSWLNNEMNAVWDLHFNCNNF